MACNEIWAVARIRDGQITQAGLQLVGAARELAREKGLDARAVLLGCDRATADDLAGVVDGVLWLNDERLNEYDAAVHAGALFGLMDVRGKPVAIFAGTNDMDSEVIPRLAAMSGAAFASSCVKIRWEGDNLTVGRPVYGGKVYEELALLSRPAVVTVRPGAFDDAQKLAAPGSVEEISVEVPASSGVTVVERVSSAQGGQDLSDARRVVAGGRGVCGESYQKVEALADALDGSIAASRALVDAGERPHEQQVGKSGKTISPELYIACGISGAIHHVLGMNTSKVVVAVNSDPDAPIFAAADLGMVGDVKEILPTLAEAIKTLKD